MIELPQPVRVLRYRFAEVVEFRREATTAAEWGVDFFQEYLQREYSDWYIYSRIYDEVSDYYFVVLTKGPVPVLSEVVNEGGKIYVKESIVQ